MITQFLSVFADVVTPVFLLVLIGYLAGPKLQLEARTLSRIAYFVFVPAFVFDIISRAGMDAALTTRMAIYIGAVHLALGGLAFGLAKLLRRSSKMAAAYMLIALFGNVGNFGLSMIEFRLGEAALIPGTVYFLTITLVAFLVGVAAASWVRGGSLDAALSVFKTPALLAIVPAALFGWGHLEIPLFISRTTGLLGNAMIPVMLVTLGVQLANVKELRINLDVILASAMRLLAGPALAMALVIPFGIVGLERSAGVLQAGMPAAVLTSIIALEYDLAPNFVTTTVLFSTLASLLTLTVVLALV